MNESEFRRQINRAWTILNVELGLGRALIWSRSLPVDENFRRVALDPESSYSEIYKTGLSRSAYNFVLDDYSYFQFSWTSEQEWRLAYWPNPWITGVLEAQKILNHWESLEQLGSLSHEDASELIDEFPYRGDIPPIRFEYSRSQYREIIHPAAHFHLGRNADNRWPCALLIGPDVFCLLIARLYYYSAWKTKSSFEDSSVTSCLDARFSSAVHDTQAVHEFTSSERQMLHFGRHMEPVTERLKPAKNTKRKKR